MMDLILDLNALPDRGGNEKSWFYNKNLVPMTMQALKNPDYSQRGLIIVHESRQIPQNPAVQRLEKIVDESILDKEEAEKRADKATAENQTTKKENEDFKVKNEDLTGKNDILTGQLQTATSEKATWEERFRKLEEAMTRFSSQSSQQPEVASPQSPITDPLFTAKEKLINNNLLRCMDRFRRANPNKLLSIWEEIKDLGKSNDPQVITMLYESINNKDPNIVLKSAEFLIEINVLDCVRGTLKPYTDEDEDESIQASAKTLLERLTLAESKLNKASSNANDEPPPVEEKPTEKTTPGYVPG